MIETIATEKYKVGVIGPTGNGGKELVRLLIPHPIFQLEYVAGGSSAGTLLSEHLPWVTPPHDLVIRKAEEGTPSDLDLVFISLPTGLSKAVAEKVGKETRIVDLGEDHRFADGWAYGLADVWPYRIKQAPRIANPGCYPTAALIALAPLLGANKCDPDSVIITAGSGESGAGRGSGKSKGFVQVNEDIAAYKFNDGEHSHASEIGTAIGLLGHLPPQNFKPKFVPMLIPMNRGILAVCYIQGPHSPVECREIARNFYVESPFVRIMDKPVHTSWTSGTNLAFVTYAKQGDTIIAISVIDNLGKGAAGQAIQNANLMFGLNPATGLELTPLL